MAMRYRQRTGAASGRRILAILALLGAILIIYSGIRLSASGANRDREVARELFQAAASELAAGEFDAAVHRLSRAIARDPSFGPAQTHLISLEVARGELRRARAVAAALRVDEFDGAQKALLEGWARFLSGDGRAALASFQEAVGLGGSAIAQLSQAQALYHRPGSLLGCPADALAAVEAARQSDRSLTHALDYLMKIALVSQDPDGAAEALAQLPPAHPKRALYRAAADLQFGDEETKSELLAELRGADRAVLDSLVALAVEVGAIADADTLASFLMLPLRSDVERLHGARLRMATGAALGRWSRALAAWRSLPGLPVFDPWVVEADLAGLHTDGLAEGMYRWAMERMATGNVPDLTAAPDHGWQQAFYALVHRATTSGDWATVNYLYERLTQEEMANAEVDHRPLVAPLSALHGRLALLHADTAQAIDRFERAVWSATPNEHPLVPLITMAPQRLILRELLDASPSPSAAIEILLPLKSSPAAADLFYSGAVGGVGCPALGTPSR